MKSTISNKLFKRKSVIGARQVGKNNAYPLVREQLVNPNTKEIAQLTGVDKNTVSNYIHLFDDGKIQA